MCGNNSNNSNNDNIANVILICNINDNVILMYG